MEIREKSEFILFSKEFDIQLLSKIDKGID